jgi:hypothetical protein
VFVNNPTFERKDVTIKLDSSIGLEKVGKSALSVSEIFPVELAYVASGGQGFNYGEDLKFELAPFEVRALEIKPAEGPVKGIEPRRSVAESVRIPVTLKEEQPSWVTKSTLEMANKELAHLAASSRLKPEPLELDKAAVEGFDGVYSASIRLPKFDRPQTLALPIRFVYDGKPWRFTDASQRALVTAWTEDGQVALDVTPEYGRPIWSGCAWLTFHAELDPSHSGKKIDLAFFTIDKDNENNENCEFEMAAAYLLSGDF